MSDSQITVNLTLIQVCLKLVFLIQLFIKMICESKMQGKKVNSKSEIISVQSDIGLKGTILIRIFALTVP